MMVMLPDRKRAPLPTRELMVLATTLVLMMALAHTASAATGNNTTATPIDGTINATPTNATPTATPGTGNTTTNGTAPTATSPSIGSLVSSIVNVQGVEFRSELSEARFEVEHEEDDETAVSDRLSELKERERELLWKKHDLQQAVKEGDMSREEYIVKHAELQAERQSLKRSLATLRARTNAGNQGRVETEARNIERSLDNVTGPATSRLLDSLLAQGGKVEITIERGSVEVTIERGDDIYYERDDPEDDDENRSRDARDIGARAAYERATEALGDGNWTARKIEADDDEYEVKLYRNGTEAEVKVDARTGAVRELERETVEQDERDDERRGPERARVPDWAVANGLDNQTDDLRDDLRDDGNLTDDLRDDIEDDLEDDGNQTDTRDDRDDDEEDGRDEEGDDDDEEDDDGDEEDDD